MQRFIAVVLIAVSVLIPATPVFAGTELTGQQNPLVMQTLNPALVDIGAGTASRRLVVTLPPSAYLQRRPRQPMSQRTEKIIGAALVLSAFVGLILASD
jgi:hypothetical protein